MTVRKKQSKTQRGEPRGRGEKTKNNPHSP